MTKFDDPKYNDEDAKGKTELVDLMQKVFSLLGNFADLRCRN